MTPLARSVFAQRSRLRRATRIFSVVVVVVVVVIALMIMMNIIKINSRDQSEPKKASVAVKIIMLARQALGECDRNLLACFGSSASRNNLLAVAGWQKRFARSESSGRFKCNFYSLSYITD